MNLNKSHRAAFVRAVMDDVPHHDFGEDYKALIFADVLKQAPKEILPLLQKESLRSYVLSGCNFVCPTSTRKANRYWYYSELGFSSVSTYAGYTKSAEVIEAEEKIMDLARDQAVKREALESQVRGTIAACRTLKQALELLPEFAKYLPLEAERSTMLPAVANLSATLIEAGWPKGDVPA